MNRDNYPSQMGHTHQPKRSRCEDNAVSSYILSKIVKPEETRIWGWGCPQKITLVLATLAVKAVMLMAVHQCHTDSGSCRCDRFTGCDSKNMTTSSSFKYILLNSYSERVLHSPDHRSQKQLHCPKTSLTEVPQIWWGKAIWLICSPHMVFFRVYKRHIL